MRIEQIRFKNLNSLLGEWQIDLQHPAYSADGIFAITGPTGAGKSTILDALCLALYGRTPRLNRVTKSENEIMSRQSGECFAEVTFTTQAGRYRSHWSQHRARKKPEGELQAPKHEIALADSGEILEASLRGVTEKIESITGMDFDRFTRSMLLAQGGFAAFLQAAANERAPILEQITGTEIYSQISIRVHEQQRAEADKLKLLEAETAGIQVLDSEQEQALEQLIGAHNQQVDEQAAKTAEMSKALNWLTQIEALKHEIAQLDTEAEDLQIDLETFKPEQARLVRAEHAASIAAEYATLGATRKQQADDRASLEHSEAALPALKAKAQQHNEALKNAELDTAQAKSERQQLAPIWQQVRLLDQQLADQQRAQQTLQNACENDAANKQHTQKALSSELQKREKADKAVQQLKRYQDEHRADQWLLSGLAGVEEQLKAVQEGYAETQQLHTQQQSAEQALKQASEQLERSRHQAAEQQQQLESTVSCLRQGEAQLGVILDGRLLREYRADKEALLRELALHARIAELEQQRSKLEDGKACPLCGALEHPFAEGNVPLADAVETQIEALNQRIAKAEEQEARIKQLELEESQARNALNQAEIHQSQAASDKQSAEKSLHQLRESLEKQADEQARISERALHSLKPLGITEILEASIPELLDSLRKRLQSWQEKAEELSQIETEKTAIDSEIKRLEAVIETQTTVLNEKYHELNRLQQTLEQCRQQRQALYGEQNPDAIEQQLNQTLEKAEVAEKQARESHQICQQQCHSAETQIAALKQGIEQRQPQLQQSENQFTEAREAQGFVTEEQFLSASLAPEIRAQLRAQGKALEQRQTDLQARQQDRKTRLQTESALQLTEQCLPELKPQLLQQELTLQAIRDQLAEHKLRLKQNVEAKQQIKSKQAAIEAQKQACQRWDNLHQLIGSADGKKYRNFAQGLTFDIMIAHANQQLQKMSDRYLLARDQTQALELNVIDNYQAGELRSTKNLSGGESFIVSLALALGLSQMASQTVRVDSLFLDEGFGTLDDDALDTALETLASLQQDGKLIGVISHVAALKQRISTQIHITPLNGGRSHINGPGCEKLGAA